MDIGGGLFDAQEFIASFGLRWRLYNEDGTSAFDSEATREASQSCIPPPHRSAHRIQRPPADRRHAARSGRVVSGTSRCGTPRAERRVWNALNRSVSCRENGEPVVRSSSTGERPRHVPEEKLPLVTDFLKFVGSKDTRSPERRTGFTPARVDAWKNCAPTIACGPSCSNGRDLCRSFSDIRARPNSAADTGRSPVPDRSAEPRDHVETLKEIRLHPRR